MNYWKIARDMLIGFLLVFWAHDSPLWAVAAFGIINAAAWAISAVLSESTNGVKERLSELEDVVK